MSEGKTKNNSRTLLLTSAGVRKIPIRQEFLKLITKPLNQTKIAYITTASKKSSDTKFVQEDKNVLLDLGMKLIELDISGKSESNLKDLLSEIDIIYMQGGDGFYLLSEIYKTGFDKLLIELLKKGIIYVGVSAGTYVACPTIEMHEWLVYTQFSARSQKDFPLCIPFFLDYFSRHQDLMV